MHKNKNEIQVVKATNTEYSSHLTRLSLLEYSSSSQRT